MYDAVAKTNAVGESASADVDTGGCCPPASGAATCCGTNQDAAINAIISTRMGYTEDQIKAVPDGANMGLGCGAPLEVAKLQAGEVVVDLGSGGGFDCFLAAREVGESGMVIGVDMTPAMVSKARANAERGKYANVVFRLGEIEHLPIGNDEVDVIISNCVINLSPDKLQVFDECWRVLKPGGRVAFSDVVATIELPEEMRRDAFLIGACIGGASLITDLQSMLENAGFVDVSIEPKDDSRDFIREWAPGRSVEDYVVSAYITARKPEQTKCC
ncbi:arsenite S-adenosylmethyltransferase [Thecamonas trahens ATCC 50062]|uniref:Arsenite methyltransferase n=1 Tax=Thecamonas trahens ATCC 50062 TaxID=461836 RepID=A0A0L0DBZ0_THETB|nr:arsenite S-adenosylmethyltransferase [Thecamonas trahens ATCC 50062]KNC49862.1 arsenite S-adenosylmethyltransferase [Thecamonas trahens ATCC 50062]|eukprot:XP_013757346.1 arsenite S-adenosylmethyltransferase [Thecamonas trahens ATCC 50062]